MDIVKDLMVPVAQCATAKQDITVLEAIQIFMGFPENQTVQGRTSWSEVLLVLDNDNHVVGSLSHADIVLSMERRNRSEERSEDLAHTSGSGLSHALLGALLRRSSIWGGTFDERCQMALNFKVKDCVYTPGSNGYVQESDSLEVAIRHLALGNRQSLLVRKGDIIVGLLILNDVFEQVVLRSEQRDD